MKQPARAAALALAALVLPLATAGAAHADHDEEVLREGRCARGVEWKIRVKPDDGRLEVEAEIDSNRAGQQWAWQLQHDGSRAATGTARTAGRSGSFSVERKVADHAGTDAFVFRASRAGEQCVARVAY